MISKPKPVITVFKQSPDQGRGLARDMRVRWALEEVGKPYNVRPVSFEEMKGAAHRELQPFGQIPTYEEGDFALFETGAIVFHIADRNEGLFPEDSIARIRAINWMFAALSTLEPVIVDREMVLLLERDEIWFQPRLHAVKERIRQRLKDLSRCLGSADWFGGTFSAGDLITADVLRRVKDTDLLEEHSNLLAFVERAESRPAFKRAFDAQLAFFVEANSGCAD